MDNHHATKSALYQVRTRALLALPLLLVLITLVTAPPAEAVIHLGDPNTVSLSNGLVAFWPLDRAVTYWDTGTTLDLSGQGNTGHLISMSTSTSPTPGKIGQALKLNGTSGQIAN
jgi:hypothetical protein